MDTAPNEYAAALGALRGRASLPEAVEAFLKRRNDETHSRPVQDVVDELIATRKKDGSSIRHLQDLRSRLNRFAESFHCEIASVTAAGIQNFLLALNLAPKTVNNFRTAVSNLFGFARLMRYVPKDFKPLEEVREVKEPERDVGIYTPEELRRLIRHARPGLLAYLAIAKWEPRSSGLAGA